MPDSVCDVLQGPSDNKAAIRKTHEDDVPEVFKHQVIDDISHMGTQIHQRTGQMHTFSKAREAWSEHLVPLGLQELPYVPETVGAAPGTMH